MSRPIWRGAINFGLVNVPVDLVTAVRDKSIHFHMLSKDGSCRLRRKLFCPETGKEFDFTQTARGIEIGPEQYAVIDERELRRLKPERARTIEIVQFVDLASIDPIFYERVYYLKPHDEAYKAYRLLVEAMHAAKMCAVAKFVMRDKQYMAVIRTLEDGLVLHTLHYADEVLPIDDLFPKGGARVKMSQAELSVASQLIKAMTHPLDIEQFRDEYRAELQELIDAKVEGKELVHVSEEESEPSPRPRNLMDALRRSLAATPGNGRRAARSGNGSVGRRNGSSKSNSSRAAVRRRRRTRPARN